MLKIFLGLLLGTLAGAFFVRWSAGRQMRKTLGLALSPPRVRTRNVRIPTSDGTILGARLYRLNDTPHPLIIIRSPYGKGIEGGPIGWLNHLHSRIFCEAGFSVLLVDARGRYDSDGEFIPFMNERMDGHDVLRWVELQDFHDGNVGLFGHSYGGYCAWAVADDPAVGAIVTLQGSTEFASIVHPHGGIALDLLLRFFQLTSQPKRRGVLAALTAITAFFRQGRDIERVKWTLPLVDADEKMLGHQAPGFRDALTHDAKDSNMWLDLDQLGNLGRVKAPVLIVGGWSDPFLSQGLRDAEELRGHGLPVEVLVGPWIHGELSELWIKNSVEFFREHLERDVPGRTRMRLVRTGDLKTLSADTLALPAFERSLCLYQDGRLDFADAGSEGKISVAYDPDDPPPQVGGSTLDGASCGPKDQRLYEGRDDVVSFTTPPLEAGLDLTGRVDLFVTADSELESFDIFARLCVVDDQNVSTNVIDGYRRFRAAPGLACRVHDQRVAFEPGCHRFKKGERLRLTISPGAHPRFARNLGFAQNPALSGERKKGDIRLALEGCRLLVPVLDTRRDPEPKPPPILEERRLRLVKG